MLGGGTFTSINKVLPGTYHNFISTGKTTDFTERGTVAMPVVLDWGPVGEAFKVTVDDFSGNSLAIFGYETNHEKMLLIRDLFKNANTVYFYRLATLPVVASSPYGSARYPGVRGNDLTIVISPDVDNQGHFIVNTIIGTKQVDSQRVQSADLLKDNDFIIFDKSVQLVESSTRLSGGDNGTVVAANYQEALDAFEPKSFNILGCPATDDDTKSTYVEYTRRLRDSVGSKFQVVVHRYPAADYEAVISVTNNESSDIVYWVAGASAGCSIEKSNTNKLYDGETAVDSNYKQSQLEDALESGQFIFHKDETEIRVLEDINTLITYTEEKSEEFGKNQTIRIIDQIATDTAAVFNERYLGTIPNDESGRISLWNDLVKHRQGLQDMRAIENFVPDNVKISQGPDKNSVVVDEFISIVGAMTQLYITTVID